MYISGYNIFTPIPAFLRCSGSLQWVDSTLQVSYLILDNNSPMFLASDSWPGDHTNAVIMYIYCPQGGVVPLGFVWST